MSRRLPPLNSFRAFEAAARYLSFTKAAEELHVTAAAVSQQVKVLEEYFNVQLFRRLTRALMLTDAGQSVLPALQEGFDKLAEADRLLRNRQDERVLTVSVPPSFGAKWLVPRLDRFRHAYPDYDVRIDATDVKVDFKQDNTDIALRYGRGNYKGLITESLLSEFVIPVCSPVLLKGKYPLKKPEDLRHHTLLHVEWKMENEAAPNWRMWLRAAGVENIDSDRGPRFSLETMAVQAASEGQGVALASSALVQDDIAAGRLIRPFPDTEKHETEFCYYVVYPKIHLERPKVKAFRDWVTREVQSKL